MRKLYALNLFFFWFFSLPLFFDLFYTDSKNKPMPLYVDHKILEESPWFDSVKPYCNPLEINFAFKLSPPPKDPISQAYAAACYTLAGKIEKAEEQLNNLPSEKRAWAKGLISRVTEHVTE